MIEYLVIGNAIDTSRITLPLGLADGVELTLANVDMATTIRKPLRDLERLISQSADNKHPEATVLDRRVSRKPSDEPLRMSEILKSAFDLGKPPGPDATGGWLEYGREGSDHLVVKYDLSPDRTYHLIRIADADHVSLMTVITALSIGEYPLLCPLGMVWDGPDDDRVVEHGHQWAVARFEGSANDELREAWSTEALASPLVVDDDWRRSIGRLLDACRPIAAGTWPGIQAAFQRRLELASVPADSPLRHLGFFVVMEALLTHPPAPGDPADTLGRQLQTKLPLLSNRMDIPLPFGDLDSSASTNTLLSALYTYRSAIAHGAEPSFDGKQQVLRSREKVGAFLDVTTRRLLRQAALEPQLVTDLKGPARHSG
jgi:hypothetical protein